MASSPAEIAVPHASAVAIDDNALTVELSDGRAIAIPFAWYPRLVRASAAERGNWRLVGEGQGIHWPDLDEDISVAALLAGEPSRESPASLRRWLAAREH